MKKADISKAIEVLRRMQAQKIDVHYDNMTADKTIEMAIEALVMQYDKAD